MDLHLFIIINPNINNDDNLFQWLLQFNIRQHSTLRIAIELANSTKWKFFWASFIFLVLYSFFGANYCSQPCFDVCSCLSSAFFSLPMTWMLVQAHPFTPPAYDYDFAAYSHSSLSLSRSVPIHYSNSHFFIISTESVPFSLSNSPLTFLSAGLSKPNHFW